MADLIPDNEVQVDQPKAADTSAPIPDNEVKLDSIPDEEVQLDSQPKEGLGTKINNNFIQPYLSRVEGAARTATLGLSDKAEVALGVPKEDIQRRAGDTLNSTIGSVAGVLTSPVNEAAAAVSGGSKILQAALSSAAFAGGGDMSDAFLGKGDPNVPVSSTLAHIGAATLIGLATGGIFSALGKGASGALKAVEAQKMGTKGALFLQGLHNAANGIEVTDASSAYNKGYKAFDQLKTLATNGISQPVALKAFETANHVGGPAAGSAAYIFTNKILGSILDKPISNATAKVIGPAALRALSSGNTQALFQALDYATKADKGARAISDGIGTLFSLGGRKAYEHFNTKDRDTLDEIVKEGGTTQQLDNQMYSDKEQPPAFAEGGMVKPKPTNVQNNGKIGDVFPEQDTLLAQAKARIYNHLNGMRPLDNMPKAPFDAEPPQTDKHRSYKKALDLANHPLSVLNDIQDGSLTTGTVTHFQAMYPELYQHLSKKITERMAKAQMDGHKPPFRVRQALSHFLGADVDSSLSQPNIMAAQMVFAQKKNAMPPAPNSKTKLTKASQSAMTGDQARLDRQQSGKA